MEAGERIDENLEHESCDNEDSVFSESGFEDLICKYPTYIFFMRLEIVREWFNLLVWEVK